jgi:tRNA pseudouridine38-40 synthase
MPRFSLGLEYDGTDFVGWQSQLQGRSVQQVLAAAVSRVASEAVSVHAAGRTDSGVHASGQVVHFDAEAARSSRQWCLGINSNLPPDVAVRWVRQVDATFDARRSALWRRYRYQILISETRPVLARRASWWLREALDVGAMTAAAAACVGEHDFSAFRAANCQSHTPHRHLSAIEISRTGPVLALEFTANAFLYHMVRNLVGSLVAVGRAKAEPAWIGELLQQRDRSLAAATAPAAGLSLVEVCYPKRYGLPTPGCISLSL